MQSRCATAITILMFLVSFGLAAEETLDLVTVNRILDEGLNRSEVMETFSYLTDVIGPRLTGSPKHQEASEWTRQQLAEWGLVNARVVPFPFGDGWSFTRSEVRMLVPREVPLVAFPLAWTPGTAGPVRGPVMRMVIESEEELADFKGQVEGKILLLDPAREPGVDPGEPSFSRFTASQLDELLPFEIPSEEGIDWDEFYVNEWKLTQAMAEFLVAEKALAVVKVSTRDNGLVRQTGWGSWGVHGAHRGVAAVTISSEGYNRILRLLDREIAVELEINVAARFHEDDQFSYNTMAEIPGSDLGDEVVLVGAHLDSWHAATGATDNGAGCAVMMEAMRILAALEVKPRRTIRIGLWSGEEQGYFGSIFYVNEHLAARPEPDDAEQLALPPSLRDWTWPITTKPDHGKLSAYFNLDNGAGKVRGIYAQQNSAVRPIFAAWLEPFADFGAATVTLQNATGTDHIPFDAVGIPAFQFIQDDLDYWPRTHHSNIDDYEHVPREDLMQASMVIASFAYHAAMRDQMLPRKPLPQGPQ